MNKKIKVIDLLNKIANGEEVPREIEYQDKIFVKLEDNDYTTDDGVPLVHLLNYNLSNLNDEVEILEDNTEEIEELLTIEDYECDKTDIRLNRDKINELVKAINSIRKDKNND